MATAFLESGRSTTDLKIITWNINGIKNKLDNENVRRLLLDKNIICLNEIKTGVRFCFPGFSVFTSGGTNKHRGGCAVLITDRLKDKILFVNNNEEDFIYFSLKCFPGVYFVSAYVPPYEPPYFTPSHIARINALLRENSDVKFVLLGDMNARYAHLRSLFVKNSVLNYLPSLDQF